MQAELVYMALSRLGFQGAQRIFFGIFNVTDGQSEFNLYNYNSSANFYC